MPACLLFSYMLVLSFCTCNLAYMYLFLENIISLSMLDVISNMSDSVSSGYPNTEKRVENTTRSGVFLSKFEVFG